ncbi:MAG: SOS response-associated peptidase, partial [Inquilinus sp.]|nr:SOS response-associated peptidase [Inquilinus sp.]
PYLIRLKTAGPFAFAGVWENWIDKASGERIESCTIIVTQANALVAPIHDRMPVILAPDDYDSWLDPAAADGRTLLRPYPAEAMEAFPVSPRVGNVKNDDAGLIEPVHA